MKKLSSFSALLTGYFCCSILVACSAGGYGRSADQLSPDIRAGAESKERGSGIDGPAKRNGDLLYVTNTGNNTVTFYSYGDYKLIGTLKGFSNPTGLCADNVGDIFITDTQGRKVFEYAHGGATPIKVLVTNEELQPFGCSVDPLTGNLAVAYIDGQVGIYRNARGSPKLYNAEPLDAYYCSYDERGDLFVDGDSYYGYNDHFLLVELASGKHQFKDISLSGVILSPGQVQWDGKYLDIGDPDAQSNVIDRIEVSGTQGIIRKVVHFNKDNELAGFWIQGNKLFDPEPGATGGGNVVLFRYPKGDAPIRTVTDGIDVPESAVLSAATSI